MLKLIDLIVHTHANRRNGVFCAKKHKFYNANKTYDQIIKENKFEIRKAAGAYLGTFAGVSSQLLHFFIVKPPVAYNAHV